nr:beta-glucuronidase [Bacteroidaceae bacterium]
MKKSFLFVFVMVVCAVRMPAQLGVVDLSGEWQFQIDRADVGEADGWFKRTTLDDTMRLPGSMPEMLKGDDVTTKTVWTGSLYDSSYYYNPAMECYRVAGDVKLPFFLTPDKHYVGAAWYIREVTLAKEWMGQHVTLFLERPHWESTVWVNGRQVGMQNSLCVAHEFDVTPYIKKGKNLIAIRIDNRVKDINPGPDSHSITDQTQGNWNGIVGAIELRRSQKVFIDDVQVWPRLADRSVVVVTTVTNATGKAVKGALDYVAKCESTARGTHHINETRYRTFAPGTHTISDTIEVGEQALLWDEFHPDFYRLQTHVCESYLGSLVKMDRHITSFGMREFKVGDNYFYVNGRKTLLRGTVENCDFPLTGYAPMDEESWERVFRICKSYGLNHMRFHSFCPPEAAFAAADRVGFYLQPEGPSWPNHGSSLGNGEPIDDYLWAEAERMVKAYGNHPSFCMMAIGNEPRGNWVEWVSRFVDYWKERDPRRVYTGASVGGGWQWQPKSQYHVKAGARGLEWTRQQPNSMDDFRDNRFILQAGTAPYVSHETGQWCVFPNFDERRKYTGVNKAKNFDIFRDILAENDMAELGHDFMMASGKLQALCYKNEIEKTLRTPGYAGFQLLALNDYSGQGTALVGVTDVFFGAKEYINADEWHHFCCETVPLARLPKFVYTAGDTLKASIEMAHFGENPIERANIIVYLCPEYGVKMKVGHFIKDIPIGSPTLIGDISLPVTDVKEATKYRLEVLVSGTNFVNDWDVWFYPAEPEMDEGNVYITSTLDDKAMDVLDKGGDVLICAAGKVTYGADIRQQFLPVFWNTSWFKMRPPHTTGLFVNDAHPLFREFPTDYHSDVQWWELVNNAQVMLLSDF